MLGLLAVIQPGGADPRLGAWLGSWKLISAQSSLDAPNRLSITPLHNGVHVVMTGETHFDFNANWNGHESSAPGNLAFDQIELRGIDKRQAEVKEKKNGDLIATVREKISKDGNELTTTTATRGKADQITVWTRTGGAKDAKDLFAGDWTQDMSKTRLRQGLVLKIEADGTGGVRFLGDFSYVARFARKAIRSKELAQRYRDAYAGRSSYGGCDLPAGQSSHSKRQVGGLRRWSADDARNSGTLETGQRVTEKLVFKKQ